MLTIIYPRFNGNLVINSSYEIVKRAISDNNYENMNMHDFNIVQNGTAAVVLTTYNKYEVSRTQAQAETKTVFAWHGTDHIGLDETTFKPHDYEDLCDNKDWDIHHFNSIDQFPDGDYLLSSRHTSAIYKISHTNGTIVWRLGGLKTDFHHGRGTRFSRQHHARVYSQNSTHVMVTLFDNAIGTGNNEHATHDFSRGLLIALDLQTMQAELVSSYDNPHGRLVNSRGSTQVLPDGNVFMGWVYGTLISEHSADGTVLTEGHLLHNLHTYRSYKYEWKGQPLSPPNVYSAAFVAGENTTTMVYVSWNGATEVARWVLYEAEATGHVLRMLKSSPRTGFETELEFIGFARYVVMEAVDKNDQPLGRSDVFMTIPAVQEDGLAEAYLDEVSLAGTHSSDQMADGAYDADSHGGSRTSEARNILMAPVSIFILGFSTCAAICAVLWLVWRSQNKSWWKLGRLRYESAQPDEEEDWERDVDIEESQRDDEKSLAKPPVEKSAERQPLVSERR